MSSDAYFAALVDCAPDALVVFDERAVIHYVNKQSEHLFGYARSELLRCPLSLVLPGGLSQPLGAEPVAVTVEARHKAGTRLYVEAAVARTELPNGPIFTAACRGKSRLLPLPDATRSRSELLANLSHELRSPLNVIIGFAKLMYRKRVGEVSDTQREYLGDILNSAEHLLVLIDDVITLAKLEAGKLELQIEPMSLALLLHEACESTEALARAKRITLSVEAADDEIEVDADKLRQVLINILSFALRVAPAASSLQLQAQPQDNDQVRVAIRAEAPLATACAPDLAEGGGVRSLLTERLAEQIGARICTDSDRSLSIVLPRRGQRASPADPTSLREA